MTQTFTKIHSTILNRARALVGLIAFAVVSTAMPGHAQIADVSINKIGPGHAAHNSIFNYLLVVNNAGPGIATDVTVTDVLPQQVDYINSSATAGSTSYNAGTDTVSAAIGTMLAGETVEIIITVKARNSSRATNTATVSSTSTDPNPFNNFDTNFTNLGPGGPQPASLSLLKSAPPTAQLGGVFNYTIEVGNAGPFTAQNVTITDQLPANVSLVSAATTGGTVSSGGNFVMASVGNVAVGTSQTVTLTVSADAEGIAVNTADASSDSPDPALADNISTAVTTIGSGEADVSIDKSAPITAQVGTTFSYTIIVDNSGPDSATSVTINDVLPANVTYVSSTSTQGTTTESLGVVTADLGLIPVNGSATVTIDVLAQVAGIADNTATVSAQSNDANGTDNSDMASTLLTAAPVASADLELDKAAPTTATVGDTFNYVLIVTNNGPDAATSVTVSDTLPPNVTYVSSTSSSGTTSETAGIVTAELSEIASGTSETVTITVTAASAGAASNSAVTTSETADPDGANNVDGATTIISEPVPVADLTLDKTAPTNATVGDNFLYTITVVNEGPDTATTVTVTDTLPGNVTYVSSSATQGSTSEASGVVTAELGDVASGDFATVTITVTAASPGLATNTAATTSSTDDPLLLNNTDSAGTTITAVPVPSADLIVDKTAPANATVGNNFVYTINVVNDGPDAANSVTVTDTLPANVTYVSSSASQGSTSQLAGVVTANLGSIGSGDFVSVTITVTAASPGLANNTATANSSTDDPLLLNNTDSAGTIITAAPLPSADLSVNKSAPANATVGDTFNYTINAVNDGPDTANSVTVTDTLPANVTYVSSSASQGSTSQLAGVVTANLGSIGSGDFVSVTITVTAASPGLANNTATANSSTGDPAPGNNTDVAATIITAAPLPSADLSVNKSAPANATVGDTFNYTINVVNDGPDTANGVTVTDTLPANVTYVSSSASQGSTSQLAGVVTANLGSIGSGDFVSVTITVTAASPGLANNTATVNSSTGDPAPGNNTDSAATTIAPLPPSTDLILDKTAPANATVGNNFNYVITVNNNGPDTATSVAVADTLPVNVTFVSATTSQGSAANLAGVVSIDFGTILSGGSATATITVTATAPGLATNSATVSSSTADPNLSNNTDNAATTIVAAPVNADLNISKSAPATATVGDNFNYVLTISNNGPETATNVVVSDPLPAQVAFISASASAGSVFNVANVVTANLGSLANGASATVTITVTAVTVGTAANSAQVSTTATDGNLSNNVSVAQTVISSGNLGSPTDLATSKTVSADFVEAGTTVSYTLFWQNKGPAAGVDVTISDVLPAGLTVESVTYTGTGILTVTTDSVTVDHLILGVDASESLQLVAAISSDSQGLITNTVTISGANSDLSPGDNSGSAVIAVDRFTEGCGPDLGGQWPVRSSVQKATTTSLGLKSRVRFLGKLFIVNLGSVTTPKSTLRYYLSDDQKWDPTDLLVGTKSLKAIKPARTKKVSVKARMPLGLDPTGKYLLVVLGNPNLGNPDECRFSNNILTSSQIPPPLPRR